MCFVSSIVPIVRFVFSSFVVSTSFVSFASRLVSSLVSCFALHSPPFLYFYFPSTYFFSINNFLFSTSSFRPVRCYRLVIRNQLKTRHLNFVVMLDAPPIVNYRQIQLLVLIGCGGGRRGLGALLGGWESLTSELPEI